MKPPPVCWAGEADARPGPEITGNVITMITTQPSSQPTISTSTFHWCLPGRCLVSTWSKLTGQYVESCLCALLHYCIMLYYAMTWLLSRRSAATSRPPTSEWTIHFPFLFSLSKSSIQRFVITEKAPTRAFSWLKAATTAFTFKALLRHYAKRVLTPQS